MKLSTRGRYGIHAMYDLAEHYGDGPQSIKCIAERQGIPEAYLEQLIAVLRKEGVKVGLIRPIMVWPFPKKPIAEAAEKVKGFLSVELSMGQMIDDIRLAEACKKPVALCNRAGGMIPSSEMIVEKVHKMMGGEY